ncbi:MAG TPA: hypothetical protein VM536_07100, partial [Chloroflexia bacterium]|nr:hypothetical protein [Chloroflexia bacterium]
MFNGFQNEEGRVALPESFFGLVLPQITNLAELKVTLHVFWRLAAQVGHPRLVSYAELAEDAALGAALTAGRNPRPAEEWLREGLELAVARGTLLHLIIEPLGGGTAAPEFWYLVNTPFNARWLADVSDAGAAPTTAGLASAEWLALLRAERAAARGQLTAAEVAESAPVRITRHRAGIYELYEKNIGVITPLLAEQLAEAERLYPAAWIE